MESHITPARIANSICQDESFNGHIVLLEGKRDLRTYNKFLSKSEARPIATFGKYNMREVYKILTSRNFDRKIGIRDADFLRINGNPKFSESYSEAIFATDGHDSEIMMIKAGTLPAVLDLISDTEKVNLLTYKMGVSIQDITFRLIRPIGNLRLANKRHNLGLSFKPEKPEGNRLRLDRFICTKTWQVIDNAKMINTVVEYSKNRGQEVASRELVLRALNEEILLGHPDIEILNGHDASQALLLIAKEGLGSKSRLLQDASCVEDLLSGCFDWLKFSTTDLFLALDGWQKSLPKPLFVSG